MKTWLVSILSNLASRHGAREARTVPFSSLTDSDLDAHAGFGSESFEPDGPWRGHWTDAGGAGEWQSTVEIEIRHDELLDVVRSATATLPQTQRRVFVLRDVEQWSTAEVSDALHLSPANQRVLLHRARLRVRLAVASYLDGSSDG